MNIHLMLILLSFHQPKLSRFDEVLPAPQVSCPASMAEYRATLAELRHRNALVKLLKERV